MKRLDRTKTGARPRPGPGFTLVELLVVMGIIGLLIGLLIPAVNAAIVATRVAATKNTIEGLDSACQAFHSDWGCFPPSGGIGTGSYKGGEALGYCLLGPGGAGWGSQQPSGQQTPFGGSASTTYAPYYSIDAKYYTGSAIKDALQPQRWIFYFCADKTKSPTASDLYNGQDCVDKTVGSATTGWDTSGPAKFAFPDAVQFKITCKKPKPGGSATDLDAGWDWVRKDYMIISCGPDRYWGPVKVTTGGATTTVKAATLSELPDAILDDITNFN